ncbi:MAG TPA: hypothetical protein VL625_09705 [Patescibacteria group bacterium]|nr:hypothetical protein [Patescibacteria group bacterium]
MERWKFLLLLAAAVLFLAVTIEARAGQAPPTAPAWYARGLLWDSLNEKFPEEPGAKITRLAGQGDPFAEFIVGWATFKGYPDHQPDEHRGIRLIRASALQGFGEAQYVLGTIYARGFGVRQNWPEAYFWDSLATKSRYVRPVPTSAALAQKDDLKHISDEQKKTVDARVGRWRPRPPQPEITIDGVDGVYKKRFLNGDVSGDQYISENVLEIVKYDERDAYIRSRLEFYNGHTCAIWGIAKLEGRELLYSEWHDRDPWTKDKGPAVCTLRIGIFGDRLIFSDDNGTCYHFHCGMRGWFGESYFERSGRRRIRYMERLLASSEYAEAVEQFKDEADKTGPDSPSSISAPNH